MHAGRYKNQSLRVDAVVVPPYKPGIAFAHDTKGRCVRFTGSGQAMLELCAEHLAHNQGFRAPVYVSAGDWDDVAVLETDEDCWIHRALTFRPEPEHPVRSTLPIEDPTRTRWESSS